MFPSLYSSSVSQVYFLIYGAGGVRSPSLNALVKEKCKEFLLALHYNGLSGYFEK